MEESLTSARPESTHRCDSVDVLRGTRSSPRSPEALATVLCAANYVAYDLSANIAIAAMRKQSSTIFISYSSLDFRLIAKRMEQFTVPRIQKEPGINARLF
jgi:hypothetical protein